MPRLVAFLVLAGVAASALRPRPSASEESATPTSRILSPDECRLLFARSPSKALH